MDLEYNQNLYQDKVNRINTQNALVASTVKSLDNIINNVRKGNFQTKQLQAIANQYDLNIKGDITIENILNALYSKRGQSLQLIIEE